MTTPALPAEIFVQPLVLDIGRVYTKYGIAGESAPRGIVRSNLWKLLDRKTPATIEEYEDVLKPVLRQVLFRGLQVRTNDRAVLVCEHIVCPYTFKQAIARLLFFSFKFPFVSFVVKPTLAILASGAFERPRSATATPVVDGLVIGCSHYDSYVVPVLEGTAVCKALVVSPVGLRSLQYDLRSYVVAAPATNTASLGAAVDTSPHSSLEDIVARYCFVEPLRGEEAKRVVPAQFAPSEETSPDVKVEIAQKPVILNHNMRGLAGDVFFGGDDEGNSIATMVLNSLLKCEPDMIIPAVSNVVLCGGATSLDGFQYRLEQELRRLVLTEQKYFRLRGAIAKLKMYASPFPATIIPWVGGSMFGRLEALQSNGVSLAEFEKNEAAILNADWTVVRQLLGKAQLEEVAPKQAMSRGGTQRLLKHGKTGHSGTIASTKI
eukprot:c7204_g1_i1.p1 GENE.c7204_g1_i1~~c7204_g1_i1.p1  ORF type:complete len:450 (-),score=121.62 c7204_g1_i1:134-1435(-)